MLCRRGTFTPNRCMINLTCTKIVLRIFRFRSAIFARQSFGILFQSLTDHVALVESDSGGSDNVELKGVCTDSGAPPVWADALEETQYVLSRLRVKIDSLIELHSKQLTRPTLDDTSQVRLSSRQL